MQNKKILTLFMVKTARYLINDGEGEAVTLIINYYNNRFELRSKNRVISSSLANKAEEVAKKLLKRKHRINYAYKFN